MAKSKNSVEKRMFYGATPLIFEHAKEMRLNPTPAEKVLWEVLRKKQVLGLRFKFQHPLNSFIADFYCHKIKLVIEVDGGIHSIPEIKERDQGRTYEMERLGIEVIRFTNEEVFNDIEKVKAVIEKKCLELLDGRHTPRPPEGGEAGAQDYKR